MGISNYSSSANDYGGSEIDSDDNDNGGGRNYDDDKDDDGNDDDDGVGGSDCGNKRAGIYEILKDIHDNNKVAPISDIEPPSAGTLDYGTR